ncbi:MAG: Ig-like domain-containing protein [Bacteroidota bacterium]
MKNFRILLKLVVILIGLATYESMGQNLIESDLTQWIAGQSGPTASFDEFGAFNQRIQVPGPFGDQVTVWSAESNATSAGSNQSGGWIHTGITLATNKTYRIAYWMKSTGTTSCNNNAGFFTKSTVDGTQVRPLRIETNFSERSWPSLYTGQLTTDKWFLVVGYIYASDASSYNLVSGVFDPDNYDGSGNLPPSSFTTYNHKFPTGHSNLNVFLRNDLWDCQVGEIQYSYLPTIEEVNGTERSIQDLLTAPNNTISVTGIMLTSNTVNIDVGDSTTLNATISPSNATNQAMNWSSNNLAVATVTSGGVVTAIAEGNATITVTSVDDSHTDTATITVASGSGSGGNTGGGSGDSIWSETGSVASYTGNVAIGTSSVPAGYKMAVEGNIRTREIRVDQDNWPDYVFTKDYELPTLKDIQKHIEEKGHLPHMPSAREVEAQGIALGEMNRLLLEKIEELTLYILQQEKRITELEQKNRETDE